MQDTEQGESKMVLKDFSLKIKAGSKVALVGRSGSGKTTIAKLISGYMRPTSGQVIVDGQDLAEVSLKSYYKYIGYLTQEPMVFDGSVRENLLYAVSEEDAKTITEQQINEVLKKAQCEFILQMQDGLETQIGEKGIRLSGGERQRLAIAKLFLKNPEIIILDEPTSALDSFSEEAVTKAMEELFKGRTVIIIAHRLQTVKRADEIIVLEDGEIKERGSHTELVQKGGHYAQMLEMQSGF
jgi:ABC-type multidrug transport system fused ATPase/permease subunit